MYGDWERLVRSVDGGSEAGCFDSINSFPGWLEITKRKLSKQKFERLEAAMHEYERRRLIEEAEAN
jgi:hypothetical protein